MDIIKDLNLIQKDIMGHLCLQPSFFTKIAILASGICFNTYSTINECRLQTYLT